MVYGFCRLLARLVIVQTIRLKRSGVHHVQRQGGYILAVTHLSHLEPVFVSVVAPRRVGWMTRKEFYRNRWISWLLGAVGCFRVDRQGVCVSAVREAIARAQRGEVVGVFPEGGVVRGRESVLRGGPMKRGIASIAIRARVPVIPCVILGAQEFMKVRPWLPFRRGRLWIAFGQPVWPGQIRSSRLSRQRLADGIAESLREVHRQMVCRWGVHEPMLIDDVVRDCVHVE